MTLLPQGEREYMHIHSKYFDKEFRDLYDLNNKINSDRYVYCEIQLGMYGLKQERILAYKLIKERLGPAGYYPINKSKGLWKHKTRPTIFALCVDDFGIKYFGKDYADHLVNALSTHYDISVDWEEKNYCGLTLDWNYTQGYVDVLMPNYVPDALEKINILNQQESNTHRTYGTSRFMENGNNLQKQINLQNYIKRANV